MQKFVLFFYLYITSECKGTTIFHSTKGFRLKKCPILTRLSGYFTDQIGIHVPKTKQREQIVNKASFSFAYFTRIRFV